MNLIIVGLGAMIMGGAVAFISLYFWREGRDLRAAGMEARALLVRKFRNPADAFLGIEDRFVTAQFLDYQGVPRAVNIRVPSRQWFWLREGATETILYIPANPQRARVVTQAGQTVISAILIWAMGCGTFMVLIGGVLLASGFSSGTSFTTVPDPPPSQFDKTGVSNVSMQVSPQHDRIATLDNDSGNLTIRQLPSGGMLATAKGKGWRLLTWNPDGSRLAVADGPRKLVLDAATLKATDDEYTWNPPTPAPPRCGESEPIWDPARKQAARPCGNDLMVYDSATVRLLHGHRDRVLGAAWSPNGRLLASVSDDNYVRVWTPATQQTIAVSEDYPYPRAIYFSDEATIVVIDVALRRYAMRVQP